MADEQKFLPDDFWSPKPQERSVKTDASGQEAYLPADFWNVPASTKPPEVSKTEDTLRSIGSGLATGVIGIPGIPGSISELVGLGVRKGGSYLESAITGKPQAEIEEKMLASERAAKERQIVPSLPTSREVIQAAEKYIPAIKPVTNYDPKTKYGRVAKDTSEAIAGSVVGPGGMLTKLATGAAGGLTGAGAKEVFRGTSYEIPAQLAGTLVGGGATALGAGKIAASRPGAVLERGEKIAGQVLRESMTDPASVKAKLEAELAALKADPDRFAKGVKPTFAQMSESGDIQNLERQLVGLAPNSPEAIALGQQIAASKQSLASEAAKAPGMVSAGIKSPDLQQAFALQGVNPQGDASRFARATIDAFEKKKDEIAKAAWSNPAIKNVQIYQKKALGSIDDYLDSLTAVRKSEIPQNIMDQIEALRTAKGPTIPLLELQDLRSKVLSQSRMEFGKENNFGGFVNSEFAKEIADTINNGSNIRFGDKTGAGRQAWGDAVKATREYHDTFRPEFMAKLIAETTGGSQKVGGSSVFDTMFSGKKAVENLKEVRAALGTDLDKAASDWLIGKLTNNGTNVKLTQDNVQKFLANPTNASLVDEIPSLRQRIMDLGIKAGESEQAASMRQLNQGFQRAVDSGNPKTLSNFLSANGAELKSTLGTPQERKFVDALERSAKILQQLPSGQANLGKTLDKLQNGRIIDIVYGRSAGVISDAIALELAARLATLAGVPGVPSGVAGVVGAMASSRAASPIAERVGQFILGDTRKVTIEQLQKAARDPEVALLLMQKPSPEAISKLGDRLSNITAPMAYERSLDEPKEKRQGRASGGKVNTSSISDRLISAAESAKRMSNKATEPLLQTSDESIARALEIANRHI